VVGMEIADIGAGINHHRLFAGPAVIGIYAVFMP
jgi:hypothetical protein